MAKMIGLGAIDLDHFGRQRALGGKAEEDVGAVHRVGQRARGVSTACADFHWFMPSVRPR